MRLFSKIGGFLIISMMAVFTGITCGINQNTNVYALASFDSFFNGITATNDATNPWIVVNKDGEDVLSSNISKKNSAKTTISITITNSSCDFIFDYKVSSEARCDKFIVEIDGEKVLEESGDLDWKNFSHTFDGEVSEHTINLTYAKDGSYDRFEDRVLLKNLEVFTESTIIPNGVKLIYDGQEFDLVSGLIVNHNLDSNASREYSVKLPSIDDDMMVSLGYLNKTYAVNTDFVLPRFDALENQFVLNFRKTGFKKTSISFNINVEGLTMESALNGLSYINDTNNPWGVSLSDGIPTICSTTQSKPKSSTTFTIVASLENDGLIGFDYRTSSEKGYDSLKVYIDGDEPVLVESGDNDWMHADFPVTSGEHTIRFTYVKDSSGDYFEDAVYFRDVNVASGNATVSLVSVDSSMGTVSESGIAIIGQKFTATATEVEGYKFIKWIDSNGRTRSTNKVYEFYPNGDITLTAVFNQYVILDDIVINDGVEDSVITKSRDFVYQWFAEGDKKYTLNIPNMSVGKTYIVKLDGVEVDFSNKTLEVDCSKKALTVLEITAKEESYSDRIITVNFIGDLSDAITPNYIPEKQYSVDGSSSMMGVVVDGYKAITNNNTTSEKYFYYFIDMNESIPGYILFDYKNTSQKCALRLYVGENGGTPYKVAEASGASDWTKLIQNIPSGKVKVQIEIYLVHSDGETADNRLYIKNFRFVGADEKKTLSVTSEDEIKGTVNEVSGEYNACEYVTLKAEPKEGFVFVGWYSGDKCMSTDSIYKICMDENYVIVAKFAGVSGTNTQESPLDFSAFVTYADSNAVKDYFFKSKQSRLYILGINDFKAFVNNAELNIINNIYEIDIDSLVTIKFVSNSDTNKYFTFNIYNWGNTDYVNGNGTVIFPYEVSTEAQLKAISKGLSLNYILKNDITVTNTWVPIGNASAPFTGTLNGDNYTIHNLTITSGSTIGLFGVINGGVVRNIKLTNYSIKGSSNVAVIAGKMIGATLDNIHIDGDVSGTSCVGGFVADADSNTNISNSTIKGNVFNIHATSTGNVGGFSGKGGNYFNCVMYATVEGCILVGGFVGGYKLDSTFENCFMAGSVHLRSGFENNYPYFGIANGYGAWASYYLTNSGQRLNVSYTSSKEVVQIDIFNASLSYDGLNVNVPSLVDGKYTFTADALFKDTYASFGLLSEVSPNGVTSNYGGMTIRFKMSDGTYKYISTLDRKTATFKSDFDINLDDLTSYIDNFSKMSFDTTKTSHYSTQEFDGKNVSIFGAVAVDNANDFEHFAWIVNGGIPTTIGSGENAYYINNRSVATTSVILLSDIDLTVERTAEINGETVYLNRKGGLASGDMIYNFYGFGHSEMMPYRGNLYGENHTLKVEMNYPEAYLMGVISMSSEQSFEIVVENLTIEGNIVGRDSVGVVGFMDSYSRSGTIKFVNVTNKANVCGYRATAGLLGNSHSTSSIIFNNCANYGTITGIKYERIDALGNKEARNTSSIGGFAGETHLQSRFNSNVNFVNANKNFGAVTSANPGLTGYFVGRFGSGYTIAEGASTELYVAVNVGKANVNINVEGVVYTSDENGIVYVNKGAVNRYADLTDIKYTTDRQTTPITIAKNDTLSGEANVVESIEVDSSSVLNVNDNNGWIVNVKLIYTNGTEEIVQVNPDLSDALINGVDFELTNVGLQHADYDLSGLSVNLTRVPTLVSEYINALNALKSENSVEQLKNVAQNVIDKYNAMNTAFESSSENNKAKLNQYLTDNDATEDIKNDYLKYIVDSVNTSALNDLTFVYSKTNTFNADIVFTMMDGSTVTKNIIYTYAKNGTLTPTATTEGVTLTRADGSTAYVFNQSTQVTITPINITNINFTDKTVTYNGFNQSIEVSFSYLEGDDVTAILSYNGEVNAKDAGEYDVRINSLTGADAGYYTIPEHTAGKLTINTIAVTFDSDYSNPYIYNSEVQTPSVTVNNEIGYEFSSEDYSVVYSDINSTNKGSYTVKVTVSKNFTLKNSDTITYIISPKTLTSFEVSSDLIYDKTSKILSFNVLGVESNDNVNVNGYTIYNTNGQVVDAVNAGSYYVVITSLDNDNYIVNNVRVDFEIVPKAVTITLRNQTSIYGDEINVDSTAYDVTSGSVCEGDDLGVVISKVEGNTVKEYELTAIATNRNYKATFVDAKFTITKRQVSIDWSEIESLTLTFNNQNQISSISTPNINNVLNGENGLFEFEIYYNDAVTNEVKFAGEYTLKLKAVPTNYEFVGATEKTFNVSKYALNVKVQNKTVGYVAQDNNFSVTATLPDGITLNDLGSISYSVQKNGVEVGGNLEVGTYDIIAKFDNPTALMNNFDVEFASGVYTITASEFNIVGSDLTTTYNGQAVNFVATVQGVDDLTLSYTYYSNNERLDNAPIDAGKYSVVVSNTDSNYDIHDATFEITINKNKITLEINAENKVYDKTNADVSVVATAEAGLNGNEFVSTKIMNGDLIVTEVINVGVYKVIVSLTDTINFEFANHNEKSFNITANKITVTLQAQSSIYSDPINVDQTKYTVEGTVFEGDDLGVVISKKAGDNAGEYELTGAISNNNYNATFINNIYTIERKLISLVYSGENVLTYTGETLNCLKVANTDVENIIESWYTDRNHQQIAMPKTAGDYYLRVNLIDLNYTIGETNTIDVPFAINPITWDVTTSTQDKIYDGNNLSVSVTANNNIVDENLYVVTYYKDNVEVNTPKNAGSYIVKVKPKDTVNYVFESSKEVTISAREVAIDFSNYELVYNKLSQKATATITNKVNGDDVSLVIEYQGTGFINVGGYGLNITGLNGIDKDNYALPTSGLSLQYEIATLVVKVEFGKTNVDYTGKALNVENLNINFDSDVVDFNDFSINNLPTEVGQYDIELVSNNANIEFINNTANIAIKPIDITNIYLADSTVKFDGKVKSLTVNTTTLSDGSIANVVYSENAFTDKGEYAVTATITNKNYNELVLTAKLTITTNELTVIYSGNSGTYNGEAQGLELNTSNMPDGVKALVSVKYVGENYESTDKPVNAGTYKIVASSSNTDNVVIVNPEKEFTISPKTINFVGLGQQTYTYTSQAIEYVLTPSGIVGNDNVGFEVSYNGQPQAINKGIYTVAIVGLIGDDKDNYIIASDLTAVMKINPYTINVVADAKSIVYGDADVELTFVADDLLGADEFTGDIVRQSGNSYGTYTISIGTLSAGENYEINFTGATYTIAQRTLTVELETTEFTYSGNAVAPNITVGNVVSGDQNVYSISYVGNNVNAGQFTAKVNVLNSNYKLPNNYRDFVITINKQDVTDKILRLVADSAKYSGTEIVPIALVDEVNGETLDYDLTYTLNGANVTEIKNVGTYKVIVSIVNSNYSGSKEFDFEVTAITPDAPSVVVKANSNSITVEKIENAVYKINNGEYQDNNVFTGLKEMTEYTIRVKILATSNYTELLIDPVAVSTTMAPSTINEKISAIGEFDITKLQSIKDVMNDLSKVSEDELSDVDTDTLESLVSEYENYLDKAKKDLSDSRDIASSTLNGFGIGAFVVSIFSLLALVCVIRFRKF